MVGAISTALTRSGAAQRGGFKRHQAFGGKPDHLAQECRVGALLQQLAKGDLVVGHRRGPRVRVAFRTSTLPSTAAVTTAVDKSPAYARLSAVASAGDLPTAPTPRSGTRPSSTPNAYVSPHATAVPKPKCLITAVSRRPGSSCGRAEPCHRHSLLQRLPDKLPSLGGRPPVSLRPSTGPAPADQPQGRECLSGHRQERRTRSAIAWPLRLSDPVLCVIRNSGGTNSSRGSTGRSFLQSASTLPLSRANLRIGPS